MKTLSKIAAAALVATAPVHANAGIGGKPPEGSAVSPIPAELLIVGGLAVIGGGVACAVGCGGGGDSSPTPTTTTTASDIRLKTDIRAIGETPEGYTLYRFRYIDSAPGDFHIGVMAQELPTSAVRIMKGGWLGVDQGALDF